VARGHRVIKLLGLAAVVSVAALAPCAGRATAQAPDEDWRTLQTEHFRVTFPAHLEGLGRRAAARAEMAWAELSEVFLEPPGRRIDVLVTDHTDISNGYAQVVPSNRIVVFARPPVDGPSLAHFDDWLELVITHELAHIVHLDYTGNPLGRMARGLFGRADNGWPFFPGLGSPGWVIEGLATWYESRLTDAGRVHGTFHETVLRTAVLEGRFESLGQASGASPLWPGGSRAYVYGSLFFEHLLERYGEDRMTAFAEAVAGQWIPYRLDAAGRSAFGVSLTEAWDAWAEELRAHYGDYDAELAELGAVTTPERLTIGARWGLHPRVGPDGATLVHVQADGRSDTRLVKRDVGAEKGDAETVGRTNGLATFDWLPDGRLLVSQLEQAGPYRTLADLWIMDLEGGSTRLTRGERLEQPSVAPDGTWAVAVQQGGGSNALVRVAVAPGAITPLVDAQPDVHWAFPALSPDGRWIAAARWEPSAYLDVVVLDARTGRQVHRVTRDRAVDLTPAWSPDGGWIVWSSDRTGVMNLLGAAVDPESGRAGEPRLLTNVRTGLAYPSVDPSGAWIYASGYHVDGWDVERVRFDPDASGPAPPPHPRFAPSGSPAPGGEAEGEVQGYSPFPTLLPYYWQPRFREAVVAPPATRSGVTAPSAELLPFALGIETGGFDLAGRHSWAAYGQVFTDGSELEGGVGYAFRGLGNPVFSILTEQTWGSAGTILTDPELDTLYVLEREQRLDVGITLSAPSFRRNIVLSLNGGLVWEARRLLDARVQPSADYSLSRPTSRLAEMRASIGYTSARSHSFQMGGARGLSAGVSVRRRLDLGLDAADAGVVGVDRSFDEVTGRGRGYVPLWGGPGHATHVLALQVAGGTAFGPNAQFGFFGVGGASGSPEDVTGLELFGGGFLLLPVRGYAPSSRAGRHAWAGSAEYRFPIALLNWGLGAWPLHFDRVLGSLFVDAGNAWDPSPLGSALTSVGGEVTVQLLGLFRSGLQLRTGVAVPLVAGGDPEIYVRAGLAF
jgi:Tol biopolymer transport system component